MVNIYSKSFYVFISIIPIIYVVVLSNINLYNELTNYQKMDNFLYFKKNNNKNDNFLMYKYGYDYCYPNNNLDCCYLNEENIEITKNEECLKKCSIDDWNNVHSLSCGFEPNDNQLKKLYMLKIFFTLVEFVFIFISYNYLVKYNNNRHRHSKIIYDVMFSYLLTFFIILLLINSNFYTFCMLLFLFSKGALIYNFVRANYIMDHNNDVNLHREILPSTVQLTETRIVEFNDEKVQPDSELLCLVCLDNKRVILFEPCNHLCTCNQCSKEIQKCPLCNIEINNKKLIYIP
jgi:hypothetical protein